MGPSRMRWLVAVRTEEGGWKYIDRKGYVVDDREDACAWPSIVTAQCIAQEWQEYRLEEFKLEGSHV